jgi:hypothetical protein
MSTCSVSNFLDSFTCSVDSPAVSGHSVELWGNESATLTVAGCFDRTRNLGCRSATNLIRRGRIVGENVSRVRNTYPKIITIKFDIWVNIF